MSNSESPKPVLAQGEYAYLLYVGRMRRLSPSIALHPWEELDRETQESWFTIEALMSRVIGLPPDPPNLPQGNGAIWEFFYLNHRGESAFRRVIPVGIEYCAQPEYYPNEGPQWFLHAVDLERRANRHFLMKRVREIQIVDSLDTP
jgi:hypothetical protein